MLFTTAGFTIQKFSSLQRSVIAHSLNALYRNFVPLGIISEFLSDLRLTRFKTRKKEMYVTLAYGITQDIPITFLIG